jgi:hypothetical protein
LDTATARDPAIIDESIIRLDRLADQLKRLGFRADLIAVIGRVPYLRAQNPAGSSGMLQESVYAAPRRDGWSYWWSWAEPVIDGDDPAAAAAQIVRVLRSRDG